MGRIVERADGNAFYVEELIRAMAAGRANGLPDSVLAMVQARLDAEGPEGKRVLRAAAVFGERFSRAGIGSLLGAAPDDETIVDAIERLANHELHRAARRSRCGRTTSSTCSRTPWCARRPTRC